MAKANREGSRFPRLVFREQGMAKLDKSKTGALKETEVEMDWIHVARSQSFKTVFLGDSNVGKTCLARLFIEGQVAEHSTNTIGFDHHIKEMELEDGISVKLQVWDTAGMEQFRNALITKYYRNADGIALVYDITRHDSFDSIDNWIKEVKNYCGLDTVKMVLIGNKLDRASDRKVTIEEGQRLADRYGMIFIELSAMDIATLPKLNELFTDLAHRMFSLREQKELTLTSSTIIRLGRDGSISDDWVVVNTPSGPLPRYAYSHQDARLRRNRCKC